ncbi:MAG: cytochrome ubiquinol oxidase subunit I [Cyanobacteriota bacterium]|nr:cytochrome ubiquinol oxidase subunit I [Cyanobacteriota bacterium]
MTGRQLAFLLEAGFLGIRLFGWNRVPAAIHNPLLDCSGLHMSPTEAQCSTRDG